MGEDDWFVMLLDNLQDEGVIKTGENRVCIKGCEADMCAKVSVGQPSGSGSDHG